MYSEPNYTDLAPYYDLVVGDRREAIQFINKALRRYAPKAKTVLELACGSGAILQGLSGHYQLSGLDLSAPMLALAHEKAPHAKLYQADMTRFQFAERYDAIICVFDSINHLTNFTAWKRTFKNVSQHLRSGGTFIFDVNTRRKLAWSIEDSPWVDTFRKATAIIDVAPGPQGTSLWNIKVFEKLRDDVYRLHEETIPEIAFPLRDIKEALQAHFSVKAILDEDGGRGTERSQRVYFVCRGQS